MNGVLSIRVYAALEHIVNLTGSQQTWEKKIFRQDVLYY